MTFKSNNIRALCKEMQSLSLGLVNFPVGLVDCIHHLSGWQVTFLDFFCLQMK